MAKKIIKRSVKKTPKKIRRRLHYKYPCIEVEQGEHKFYLFEAPTSDLWNILEINTRIEDKDEGYQRVLSPSRVRAISRFVQNKNPIPLSVLVTFDDAKISEDGKFITIPAKEDAGWVIDGQHRLAGAHESETNISLPVVAFVGLSVKDQIRHFVTINKEAKGVPTSLYYDLLKHIPEKKNVTEVAKERAADIADQLKRDEESPFFERIVVITSPRKGEISLNNFVRKVYPLIQEGKGTFHIFTQQEQGQIISNYYKALKNVFPKEYTKPGTKFFQTLGFGALMNALPTFFTICLSREKAFRVNDATKIFKQISHFDFTIWNNYGSGSAAEIQAGEDIKAELHSAFETDEQGEGSLKLL